MYCLRKSNNLINKIHEREREFHMVIMNLISMLFLKKRALFPYIKEIFKLYRSF